MSATKAENSNGKRAKQQHATVSSDLLKEANELHQQVMDAQREAIYKAKEAGDRLIKLKVQVKKKYGVKQWTRWLLDNFAASVETARVYMKIARNWTTIEEEVKADSRLSLRRAQELIGTQYAPKVTGKIIPREFNKEQEQQEKELAPAVREWKKGAVLQVIDNRRNLIAKEFTLHLDKWPDNLVEQVSSLVVEGWLVVAFDTFLKDLPNLLKTLKKKEQDAIDKHFEDTEKRLKKHNKRHEAA